MFTKLTPGLARSPLRRDGRSLWQHEDGDRIFNAILRCYSGKKTAAPKSDDRTLKNNKNTLF